MVNKKKLFIFILILAVINGCAKLSSKIESQEKTITEDIKTEQEKFYVRQDEASKFLKEGESYLYSDKVLYKAVRVPEENKVYIYKNESVEISTKVQEENKVYIYTEKPSERFPEENKTYIYENGTLISEKFPEEKKGYIFINESEFYKDKKRSYMTGMPSGNFVPEPLKGDALNSYFKSLNLKEEYIYAMMQFGTLDGDPTKEQIQTLANDNITLFEWHGDHTYYAKIPRKILETKSYDFVRWVGIVEDPLMKVGIGSPFRYIYRNCTGTIKLVVIFYEKLNEDQINKIKALTYSFRYGDIGIVEIDPSKIYDLISLNFVNKIEWYSVPTVTVLHHKPKDTSFSNVTCNDVIKLVLSFEENITEELYRQIEEISEEIIFYESPNKPMCVLINPINFFNSFESPSLLRKVINGFVIYNNPYSIVSADSATDAILKSISC